MKPHLALLLSAFTTVWAAAQSPQAATGSAEPRLSDPYRLPPARVAQAFSRMCREQIERIASNENLTIPRDMLELLTCAEKHDGAGMKPLWRKVAAMSGQYAGSPHDGPGDAAAADSSFHVFWPWVMEVFGFSEQVSQWTPELLSQYANDMVSSLPAGAILFGGTDPGRFVPTAYLAVQHDTNRFVITQNGLADNRYMDHVRRLYGDRLSLPTTADSARAFQLYVEDVRSGKRPKNAHLDIRNGRVTISGAPGIMELNGILARMLVDRNKKQRPFFVEESHVMPWMVPFLTPQGLILRLHGEPAPLTDAVAAADHAYWSTCEDRLRRGTAFPADSSARKTYAKLRSAIGGLYASRGRLVDAEKAFEQARRLFPESPEANYRFVQEVLLRQHRFADARRVMAAYRDRLPAWIDICAKDGVAADLRTEQGRVDGVIAQIQRLEQQPGGDMDAGRDGASGSATR